MSLESKFINCKNNSKQIFQINFYLILNSIERTVEVGIFIYWDLRMTFIDQLYGYKKAEEYYVSNNIDQNSINSKEIIINPEMLRDLFVFLAAGYAFCSAILFLETIKFCYNNTHKPVLNS